MRDNVLVANPGSSSLKLRVIGQGGDVLAERVDGAPDGGLGARLDAFLEHAPGVGAAGVRVVHGGPAFTSGVVVDDDVVDRLAALDPLAPLHNPSARALIDALRQRLPHTPVVACFDTAFHHTLPDAAAVYAVPWRWTADLGVRKYGFHGLSHQWAAGRAADILGRSLTDLRLVTCHLGAGASLAAVAGGRSVDTTMGFTPLDGLVMATRSGSVDPGALLWVQRSEGLTPDVVEAQLERDSGLLGVSGVSGDLRKVLAAADRGDPRGRLAVDLYLHRLRGAMAAMVAAMGGVDAFVFTGGVGEHAPVIRAGAIGGLGFLGAAVDGSRNESTGGVDVDVSAAGATVRTLVVVAREDLQIVAEVRRLLARDGDTAA